MILIRFVALILMVFISSLFKLYFLIFLMSSIDCMISLQYFDRFCDFDGLLVLMVSKGSISFLVLVRFWRLCCIACFWWMMDHGCFWCSFVDVVVLMVLTVFMIFRWLSLRCCSYVPFIFMGFLALMVFTFIGVVWGACLFKCSGLWLC